MKDCKKMKSKVFLLLVVAIFSSTFIYSNAYFIRDWQYTGGSDFVWSYHSSLPTNAKAPTLAASCQWNVPGKFQFICTEATLSMGLKKSMFTDGYSVIAYCNISEVFGYASTINAMVASSTSHTTSADIFLNSTKKWTVGRSSTHLDYQGILTHEFGHIVGLDDNSVLDLSKPIQTMYKYSSAISSTSNGVYHLESYQARTLETDDKNGRDYLWK